MKLYIVKWPDSSFQLVLTKNASTLYYELDKLGNPRNCEFREVEDPERFSFMFSINVIAYPGDGCDYEELRFDTDTNFNLVAKEEINKPLTHTFSLQEEDHLEFDIAGYASVLGGTICASPKGGKK